MLKDNVKEWYQRLYQSDELGKEIDDDLTFEELIKEMEKHDRDIYDIIGVGDSVVRERIFNGIVLALKKEGKDVSYDDVYECCFGDKKTIV